MNLAFSNSISSIVLRSICHLSGEFSWSLIQEDLFQAQKEKKGKHWHLCVHLHKPPTEGTFALHRPPPGISIPRAGFTLERGRAGFPQVGKKNIA